MTPTRSKRPPKTTFLEKFSSEITKINYFLWVSLAAYECTVSYRPKSAKRTNEFISDELALRLNLGAEEFDRQLTEQSDRLYRLLLVEAIVHYEEYLESIIKEAVSNSWVTPKKSVKISLTLPESGNESEISASARVEAAKELAKTIVNAKYSSRHNELDKLLGIDSTSKSTNDTNHNHLILAGEFRNSIIHCGSLADERTVKHCGDIIPGLSIGVAIPLTQELLLLFDALLSHAKDVDLILRRKSKGGRKN
ncbi:hypothetical protein SAMN04244579_00813 [Azotobacter beijerinckii]|uniref:Uncharacterized protein n=1 Tax=Azotobacter beijerinckii TaxID=170623 RepID=A0A1H6RD15_9GAMM|nr:hypothetical protein [Azotobacter beijerinckii]SEI49082.1 hypothetical protein SAMN04244579_00813 [Azotobacter beijerinckii]